jgi:hypothetical protein
MDMKELAEEVYLNATCLLSKLPLRYEFPLVGVEGVEQGYSEAGGATQPAVSGDISGAVKLYPPLNAEEFESLSEDTMFNLVNVILNLHLRVAEAGSPLQCDHH